MNFIIGLLKFFLRSSLIIIGICLVYVAIAVLLTIIPSSSGFAVDSQRGIPIYVTSNGIHTDIMVPSKNGYTNWWNFFDKKQFMHYAKAEYEYLAFGWGDKDFYLNTPNEDDIKISTALKALFLPTTSVMHVEVRKKPEVTKYCRKVIISKEMYMMLTNYILSSMKRDNKGKPRIIPKKGYTKFDNFYSANGLFHVGNTCNNWVNTALKKANVTTALWTPFEFGIFYHFEDLKLDKK
ncbi:MAG: TIGR02117 family protein [Melioribacteraceae bacterium]|nr:TIGR02117 family protein [Melioribacteraceae bacterium]